MSKGVTIDITRRFKDALAGLPQKHKDFTDTEKRAVEFADALFQKELNLLQIDPNYEGV